MTFFKKKKPELIAEGNNIEKQIQALEELTNLTEEGMEAKEKDLKFLKYGLNGEKQIIYELLHSNIPMYILHDVYYEWENNSSQIDFIVITEYKIFVIECKNLIGDVLVNKDGNFIRKYNNIKEGIYSPISQNEKHIELLVNLIKSRKKGINIIRNLNIQNIFQSVIVFTNPKTIIYKDYAPKNIKNSIIKSEYLNSFIKSIIQHSDKKIDMDDYAMFFSAFKKEVNKDYTSKYLKYVKSVSDMDLKEIKNNLIILRKNLAKKEGVDPYIIYTNEQLDNLLKALPKTKDELINVKGFGEKKIEKFGDMILSIINPKKY